MFVKVVFDCDNSELGLDNSIKLIEILTKCKIDTIYSSPFIRTLQTLLCQFDLESV